MATYLELDGKASEEFQELLAELGSKEDQTIMMTWAERFEAEIMEKGRQEGRQEGFREGMEKILNVSGPFHRTWRSASPASARPTS